MESGIGPQHHRTKRVTLPPRTGRLTVKDKTRGTLLARVTARTTPEDWSFGEVPKFRSSGDSIHNS